MNIDYDRLFCFVDDFYKGFEPWYKKTLLTVVTKKRNRECKMKPIGNNYNSNSFPSIRHDLL